MKSEIIKTFISYGLIIAISSFIMIFCSEIANLTIRPKNSIKFRDNSGVFHLLAISSIDGYSDSIEYRKKNQLLLHLKGAEYNSYLITCFNSQKDLDKAIKKINKYKFN